MRKKFKKKKMSKFEKWYRKYWYARELITVICLVLFGFLSMSIGGCNIAGITFPMINIFFILTSIIGCISGLLCFIYMFLDSKYKVGVFQF